MTEYLIAALMTILAGILTLSNNQGIKMEEPTTEEQIDENRPSDISPRIIINRKTRRFIRRMSKGKIDLQGRTDAPIGLAMQVWGLMNSPLKIFKKREVFNGMIESAEAKGK